jgi:ABC-type proline/glycine betaine transport system substrate-binding protein
LFWIPDNIYGNNNQHIDLVFNKDFKEAHPAAYTIATRMADASNHSSTLLSLSST